MSDYGKYDILIKYIVIGDSGVGKSSLFIRFTEDKFQSSTLVSTIGVEFGMRDIMIGNKMARIQLWDTAGQEAYQSVAQSYYRGAAVAFLVYDITNRDTFNHLATWLAAARDHGSPHMMCFIIGNKSDMESERSVSFNEGDDFAKQNGVGFIETSAKLSLNVEDAFVGSARRIVREINEGSIDPRTFPGIKLSTSQLHSYQAGDAMSQNIVLTPTDERPADSGCC